MSTNANAFAMLALTPVSPAGPGLRIHLAGRGQWSGGAAEYDTVTRPSRRSALQFTGTGLAQLVLPVVLDGFELYSNGTSVSVEPECERLWGWTQPLAAVGRTPAVTVDGPVSQPPYRPWWVVTDIAWEDEVRNEQGQRVQQMATVTLTEYQAAEILLGPAAAARARAGL